MTTPLPAGTTKVANVVTTSNGSCSSCTVENPTVAVLNTVKTVVTVAGAPATTSTVVKAGDVVVYSIAVTNTGGASGTTVLSDTVPANTTYTGTGQGWSCTNPTAAGGTCTQSVTVAAGTTVTKSYTLTVSTPIPAGVTKIANVVTSTIGTCSSCTVENPTSPSLATVKEIVSVNGIGANAATQVKAGDVIVYTISVLELRRYATGTTTLLSDAVPANTTYTGAVAEGLVAA